MPPSRLSNDQRQRARAASGMIPGAGVVNALRGLVKPRNELQPQTPRQQARIAGEVAARRRARLARRMQADAQRSGRGALSQNEIERNLSEYGVDD